MIHWTGEQFRGGEKEGGREGGRSRGREGGRERKRWGEGEKEVGRGREGGSEREREGVRGRGRSSTLPLQEWRPRTHQLQGHVLQPTQQWLLCGDLGQPLHLL